jgi:hypothetical protein
MERVALNGSKTKVGKECRTMMLGDRREGAASERQRRGLVGGGWGPPRRGRAINSHLPARSPARHRLPSSIDNAWENRVKPQQVLAPSYSRSSHWKHWAMLRMTSCVITGYDPTVYRVCTCCLWNLSWFPIQWLPRPTIVFGVVIFSDKG